VVAARARRYRKRGKDTRSRSGGRRERLCSILDQHEDFRRALVAERAAQFRHQIPSSEMVRYRERGVARERDALRSRHRTGGGTVLTGASNAGPPLRTQTHHSTHITGKPGAPSGAGMHAGGRAKNVGATVKLQDRTAASVDNFATLSRDEEKAIVRHYPPDPSASSSSMPCSMSSAARWAAVRSIS
jgi:hypothetical protein